MYFVGNDRIPFELKESGITNIVSYRCEIVKAFMQPDKIRVMPTGTEVDQKIIQDIIEDAKGSVWQDILKDYYAKKYPNGENPSSATTS